MQLFALVFAVIGTRGARVAGSGGKTTPTGRRIKPEITSGVTDRLSRVKLDRRVTFHRRTCSSQHNNVSIYAVRVAIDASVAQAPFDEDEATISPSLQRLVVVRQYITTGMIFDLF